MRMFLTFFGIVTSVSPGVFEEFEKLTDHLPNDLPAEFNCDGTSRIIGGVTAEADTWPFMVHIKIWKSKQVAKKKPDSYDQCGGSIIHDQWVMTGNFVFSFFFLHFFYFFFIFFIFFYIF